jgi:hypothetical protein
MKRTTLLLDPVLYGELRRQALAEHITLTERLERVVRVGLEAEATRRRSRVALPSYDLGPYRIDVHDRGAWAATGGRERRG